jgi:hypothetical protein
VKDYDFFLNSFIGLALRGIMWLIVFIGLPGFSRLMLAPYLTV